MVAGQGRAEVVMSGPADAGALPPSRLRRLTQAALNADVTLGHVETVDWLLSPLTIARQQLSRLVIIGRSKGEGGHVEE